MFYFDNHFFGIAASALSVLAFFPYIRSIIKGQTKPSAASWWTWFFITSVTVASSWSAGASWNVLALPLWLCFSQLLVAVLSIKYGDNNWDLWNKICVGGASFGVALWLITGQPLVALAVSIIADLFASIPNIRHVLKNPEQENRTGWILGWGSAVFEIFAVSQWTLAESSWAVYFFLNMTVVLIVLWRTSFRRLSGNSIYKSIT